MEDAFAKGNWTRYFVRYNKHAAFEWPQPLNTFLGVCLIFSLHVYPWYAYRSHPILYLCCIGCTASLPLLLPHTFCTSHSHCRFCTWKTPVILTPWEILNAFPCFSCTNGPFDGPFEPQTFSVVNRWASKSVADRSTDLRHHRDQLDRGLSILEHACAFWMVQGLFFAQQISVDPNCVWKETYTPPKLNMESENKSPEKESPFGKHYFKVPAVKFRWSIISDSFSKIRKKILNLKGHSQHFVPEKRTDKAEGHRS